MVPRPVDPPAWRSLASSLADGLELGPLKVECLWRDPKHEILCNSRKGSARRIVRFRKVSCEIFRLLVAAPVPPNSHP